jgi:hypothetical protein
MGSSSMTEAIAVEIYKCKLAAQDKNVEFDSNRRGTSEVARLYGCSPKTVRDIWNHVTWKYATKHLWSTAPALWKGRASRAEVK